MSKWPKNLKFRPPTPDHTQSKKNTELEELRHPEVVQDLSRSQPKFQKSPKIVKIHWKFSQNLTKFWTKMSKFWPVWSILDPAVINPQWDLSDSSAIARLFQGISLLSPDESGSGTGTWTPKSPKRLKWPKIWPLDSNFDPDPQILNPGTKFGQKLKNLAF